MWGTEAVEDAGDSDPLGLGEVVGLPVRPFFNQLLCAEQVDEQANVAGAVEEAAPILPLIVVQAFGLELVKWPAELAQLTPSPRKVGCSVLGHRSPPFDVGAGRQRNGVGPGCRREDATLRSTRFPRRTGQLRSPAGSASG
jgi:hypothetical protein